MLLAAAAVFAVIPGVWESFEDAGFEPGYRVPHEAGNNYWLVSRWIRSASGRYPAVIMGDSVVWGHYVPPEGALSAHLNRRAGGNYFANVGVDGLHPAAMHGLTRYYGGGLKGSVVMVHLNLLWMSSPEHDLRSGEEARFNHPRLVPQVFPDIPSYRPALAQIIGAVSERNIPFISWIQHIRQTYYQNMDLLNWTLMYPHKNPFAAVDLQLPRPAQRPRGRPVPWTEAGIPAGASMQWVEHAESFQWEYFKRLVFLLQSRNNNVFVLIGPFNSHLLSGESRERYEILRGDVIDWLDKNNVPYHSFTLLDEALFADASHPLDEGYGLMADELLGNPEFREIFRFFGRNEE